MSHFRVMLAVLLFAVLSAPEVEARTLSLQQCGVARFRVAPAGSITKADVGLATRASGLSPLEELRVKCVLQAPDFITDDRTALARGVRLARPQSDSIAIITKTHLALQKSLSDSVSGRYSINGGTLPPPPVGLTSRDIFLTPAMRTLRERYAAEIRAVLQPEQLVRFESNLAELIEKDTPK